MSDWYEYGGGWPPYVPVAERRRKAEQHVAKMRRSGKAVSPVTLAGRAIASTFWGQSWCKNLEAYSDYANRLPRGRSYLRNGSVVDLQIAAGRVTALVNGTRLYKIEIEIEPVPKKEWTRIKAQCAGKIDSVVELLRGSISKSVMELVTRKGEGLFPTPRQISLSCSCPDWADMCKHVAAALYGVGSRLDHSPEMLFTLRGVDPAEMVAAAAELTPGRAAASGRRVLAEQDLSAVFGIDVDLGGDGAEAAKPASGKRRPALAGKKAAARKKATTRGATTKKAAAKKATAKKAAKWKGAAGDKSAPRKKPAKK